MPAIEHVIRSANARNSILLPIAGMLVAMATVQVGASLAKALFPLVGAQGVVALRQGLAAPILLLLLRPWRGGWPGGGGLVLAGYGIALGVMNLCFYLALRTVPLGIAVAIEFTGPLAVAIGGSRRAADFLWVVLAAAGLLLLVPHGRSPISAIDPAGALLAFGAGACWAAYILFGRAAGAAFGMRAAALGTGVAALLLLPVGFAHAGTRLFAPALLEGGLLVALLTSALPYTLEMIALPKLPARTFGTLMSLEPAVGALAGLVLLGEHLLVRQYLAIGLVMAASIGATISVRRLPLANG